MADIDKSLPNNRPEDDLLQEQIEEVDVADQLGKGPVEITDEEDGGATVDFDPNAVQGPDENDPFANLNDLLPEDVTDIIGNELQSDYAEYKTSRADWERTYITGLDLLGFKYDNRTEPFKEPQVQLTPFLQKRLHNFKH
jgi:hypothetical protein